MKKLKITFIKLFLFVSLIFNFVTIISIMIKSNMKTYTYQNVQLKPRMKRDIKSKILHSKQKIYLDVCVRYVRVYLFN